MENPIQLIIQNHQLRGVHLTETEIQDLIKMLGLLCCYYNTILELHFDKPPHEHVQGYAMSREELNRLFLQAEKLKKRLQQIEAPVATEIKKHLEDRYHHLERDDMRLILKRLIEAYENDDDQCDDDEYDGGW